MTWGFDAIKDGVDSWMANAWAAAVAGRIAWHTRLVQKGERKFFSSGLLFEIPIVVFTYLIGVGIADHLGWTGSAVGALVAVVSYLGPGGLTAVLQRYVDGKAGG